MGRFTAKDFVEYVNDEFDTETLQLMQNVLRDRITLINKMKDMANPRTVVQGYKLNKQDLQEIRGFTQKELRIKAMEILKMIGVELSEKNIQDMVSGIVAKIEKYKAGSVISEEKVSRARLKEIVREEVDMFLTPTTVDERLDERFIELVSENLGKEAVDMLIEITSNYNIDIQDKKYKTITGFLRDTLPQIPTKNHKQFLQEVNVVKKLINNDEIVI